ncbi:DNRLRE domain-containing protein [Chloroflexota bacterium]
MDEANKNTNYGSSETLCVESDTKNCRTLVHFDLSTIPTNSTNITATLSLYISSTSYSGGTTRSYGVHRVDASRVWPEVDPYGVTWNKYSAVAWTTIGGDFNATATDTQTVDGADTGWVDWDVSTDVGAFTSGTENNGWLIKDTIESVSIYTALFNSLDFTGSATLRPKLTVEWTAPWDSYGDTGYDPALDLFNEASENVAYMHGTGLQASTDYRVCFWDGGGSKVETEDGSSDGSGILNAAHTFAEGSDTAGIWYVTIYDSQAYSPGSHSASDPYIVGDDSFEVTAAAIPEFSTIIAAIGVAGMCFGAYYWMRRRKLGHTKV